MSKRVLAFRFDIDSVQCLRRTSRLRRVADARGVRFTFFLMMGRSVHLGLALRHQCFRFARALTRKHRAVEQAPHISVARKLGLRGLLETIVFNPHLGRKYREEIDALFEDGHELGLHGGTNHTVWQRNLHRLDGRALEALLLPALGEFANRYGPPAGFASPGFEWKEDVLDWLDQNGFQYASDMIGENPFKPSNGCGALHRHYQVPVNVIGRDNIPLIEQQLAWGHDTRNIIERVVGQIYEHEFALLYDHPHVIGVHSEMLDKIIERVEADYDIVTMEEYLSEWKRRHEMNENE